MTRTTEIIIDELEGQSHPMPVEDVIFLALMLLSKSKPQDKWSNTIAFSIKERILESKK
jgi:hypothetical protein